MQHGCRIFERICQNIKNTSWFNTYMHKPLICILLTDHKLKSCWVNARMFNYTVPTLHHAFDFSCNKTWISLHITTRGHLNPTISEKFQNQTSYYLFLLFTVDCNADRVGSKLASGSTEIIKPTWTGFKKRHTADLN